MRRLRLAVFLIVSVFLIRNAKAQSYPLKSKLWLEARLHYGFVVPHHENMVHLTSQHLTMFSFDVQEATNGDHYWERQHLLPIKGLSLLYSDLGGSKPLGQVVALIPYLDFNLTRGKKINLFFRFGAGMGYLTKRFDRVDNYKNIAIGSHFNAGIQLMYAMRWKVTPRLQLMTGLSLTHFSNGAIKTPNLGINIVTLSLGCAWKIDSVQPLIHKDLNSFKKSWEYSIFGIFGMCELYAAGGPKFPAFILSSTILRDVGFRHKRKMGVGLDVFYDASIRESLARLGNPVKSGWETIRPGVNYTHKMEFNRLALVMQIGVYLYTRYKVDGYVYDRLALQYCFGKHYLVHLGLKTHFFTADMIEYGVGYRF